MIGIIEGIIGLIGKLADVYKIKVGRQHIDRMVAIKKEILDEESRGVDSDDAKIETLYKEFDIELEAYKQEVSLGAINQ